MTTDDTEDTNLTDWRPPGWIAGDPDEPYVPEKIEELYAQYNAAGYYTPGGLLTEKALGKVDEQEAREVATNRKLLRDAWNTFGAAWRLGSALTGAPVRVDPFYNKGAQDLPDLEVMLDGLSPLTDGMLTVDAARKRLELAQDSGGFAPDVRVEIERRIASLKRPDLGDKPDYFPVNWRQHLKRGQAAAAANGPHSRTEDWLKCSIAYGQEEFSLSFVPDNGDGWFQRHAMAATLVVRLGRVPCSPPPGIKASSPRGASALCVCIPPHVIEKAQALRAKLDAMKPTDKVYAKTFAKLDRVLPEPTRRVLFTGQTIAVPFRERPRAGVQYALVQRAGLVEDDESIVDLGVL